MNFGAKKGGGYSAYVASKFSNDLLILDPDPNDDGNPIDAEIVGRVLLVAGKHTKTDDTDRGHSPGALPALPCGT